MKTKKPKRIRARKATGNDGRRYYAIEQSNVRALTEQMASDVEDRDPASGKAFRPFFVALMAKKLRHAFKRAGIMPGRARKGTR